MNIEGAERIASICAAEGISRFVHVSHLNASATSTSQFYRTKAEGEERVKAAFPNATIIRPGAMFGYEDKLLNNIASECHKHIYESKTFMNATPSLAHLVETESGRY